LSRTEDQSFLARDNLYPCRRSAGRGGTLTAKERRAFRSRNFATNIGIRLSGELFKVSSVSN
jgi:hypothetical protein